MLGVFGSVQGLIKLENVATDNTTFRLHYKATVILLLVFSLLVTSRQYIGDPIDCIVEGVKPAEIMDTYCWIHSTFTIPNRFVGEKGKDYPHPGVYTQEDGQEVKYHKYYQWVCFVLFLQAILFYIPRYLWKTWEGGKIKMLVLDMCCPIIDEEAKNGRKNLLIDYMSMHLHNHNMYAIRFFICELLNFANVVGQIYFVDRFLGYEFSTYGPSVVAYSELEPEDRIDPMAKVFPKVTKCTFYKFGASGTVQHIDGLCVLPLNIVNEKIYIFMWFWFVLLAVISGLALIYRLVVVVSPEVQKYLLRSRSRLVDPADVDTVMRKCQIGDWFVLFQLAKNMDPIIFKEFLADFAKKLEGKLPME